MSGGRRGGERPRAEDQHEDGRYQEATRKGHRVPPGFPCDGMVTGTACTVAGAGFPKGSVELPAFAKKSAERPAFLQNRLMKVHALENAPLLLARDGDVGGGRCPEVVAAASCPAIRTSRRGATRRRRGRIMSCSIPGGPAGLPPWLPGFRPPREGAARDRQLVPRKVQLAAQRGQAAEFDAERRALFACRHPLCEGQSSSFTVCCRLAGRG